MYRCFMYNLQRNDTAVAIVRVAVEILNRIYIYDKLTYTQKTEKKIKLNYTHPTLGMPASKYQTENCNSQDTVKEEG